MKIEKINVSYQNPVRSYSGARQTSIDCYNQIKAEGMLSKRRLQVYEILLENGALTGTEVAILFKQKFASSSHSEGIRNRLTELFDRGVIYEKGIVVCKTTGRKVTLFDLTDNLPKDIKSKPSRKQEKVNNALKALKELYRNKESVEKWREVADLIKKI